MCALFVYVASVCLSCLCEWFICVIVCLGVSVDKPCDSSRDCGDNMGCAAGPTGDQSCFCLTGHVARQDQSCGMLDLVSKM